MKFNNLQNNFSAGEWSPKMRARSETQQYFQASELQENFLSKIYGGAFRRPGTWRVEFNDSTIDGYLQNAKSTASLLNGPSQVKSKMIPRVRSNGTKEVLICTNSLPSTWVYFNAVAPDGGANTLSHISSSIALPTSAASLKYVQVGDYVFIVDGSGTSMPRVWSGSVLSAINAPPPIGFYSSHSVPYMPPSANSTNGTIAIAGAGPYILTSSGFAFESGHEGAFFKFNQAGATGVLVITSYTSATSVTADYVTGTIVATTYGAAAGTSFEEAAWSDYRGWPRAITAYQGRIIYGGSSSAPDTIWGSRIGNVFDMMERPFEQYTDDFAAYPEDNSRPFTLTPNSKEASNIRALSSDKTLIIHTDRSEIVGYGTQGALGPLDVTFESSSSFGSTTPMPVRSNDFAIFVQKGGRKLRDLAFNFDQDKYKSSDLTFAADHLTLDSEQPSLDPIVEIVSQTTDSSYVWVKTLNGRLLVLTLDRDYNVNAWARVKLGGSSEEKTFPLVKSMCTIESATGEGDRLFLLVQRQKSGNDHVQLEYLDIPYEFEDLSTGASEAKNYIHFDHKSRYQKNAANRIYSLDHLKGQTVGVVDGDTYLGTFVVNTSGEIDVDAAYVADTRLVVGLPTPATLKPNPFELGQQVPGSPQGFIKRIDQLLIKFFLSKGCKYGYKMDDLLPLNFDSTAKDKLFTGTKEVRFPSDYSRECQVIIYTDSPWPCNITAVIAKGMLYD